MNEYKLKVVVEHVENQYDVLTKLIKYVVYELKKMSSLLHQLVQYQLLWFRDHQK